MTGRVLLDTHIALWLDAGDPRLRSSTRDAIDHCWRNGDGIMFSSVSAWEIALLVDLGRIELDLPATAWIDRFLLRSGVHAATLDPGTAAASYDLHHFEQRDPADRLLVATAIELGCPLITYDQHIQKFAKRHGSRYGFRVET